MTIPCSVKDLVKRINRNILECKVHYSSPAFLGSGCINRNILECKGIHAEDKVGFVAVLIETYWNVKSKPAAELVRLPMY